MFPDDTEKVAYLFLLCCIRTKPQRVSVQVPRGSSHLCPYSGWWDANTVPSYVDALTATFFSNSNVICEEVHGVITS